MKSHTHTGQVSTRVQSSGIGQLASLEFSELSRILLMLIGSGLLGWAGYRILSNEVSPVVSDFVLFVPSALAFVAAFVSNMLFTEFPRITVVDALRLLLILLALAAFAFSFIVEQADRPLLRQWSERLFVFLLGLQTGKSFGASKLGEKVD